MKKLFVLILFISFGLFINSCSNTGASSKPPTIDTEENINTTATSDKQADLGNKIWIDSNNDGIKQRPESGFSGIIVNLYKDANKDGKVDGAVFKTTTTDKGGYYRFNLLDPDINYIIEVVAPDNYVFSNKHSAAAKNKDYDSDINPATGLSDTIDVEKGRYFYWYDAALYKKGEPTSKPGSVGDKVWHDINGDGIKQHSEPGFSGVSLDLLVRKDGSKFTKIATTITNEHGNYRFDNLNPEYTYYVYLHVPKGYAISQDHNPAAPGKDWDSDFIGGAQDIASSEAIRAKSGVFAYWEADAGLYKLSLPSTCTDPVFIPDEFLREAIGVNGVTTCKKLLEVKNLLLDDNIRNFQGLDYLVNVETLSIEILDPSKVVELNKLKKIKSLTLAYTNTSDLSVFSNLDLTTLEIHTNSNNQAVDINTIAKFKNLTKLHIYGNSSIKNISALSSLTKLESLDLSSSQVSDISALTAMTKMKMLNLAETNISSISVFAAMPNLEYVDFSGAKVNDISSLSGLTKLKDVRAEGNVISDIKALVDNTGIGSNDLVMLSGNCIKLTETPEARANINKLKDRGVRLYIDNLIFCNVPQPPSPDCSNPVTIPDPALKAAIAHKINGEITCESLASLVELRAGGGIKDLSGIEYAYNIIKLMLGYNEIKDISPLEKLTKLEGLELDANKFTNLSALSNLNNLIWLSLDYNQISDLGPLSKLENIEEIHANWNKITSIDPISKLNSLKILSLSNNTITDLSPLNGLNKLYKLSLNNNPSLDLSSLPILPELQFLSLNNNSLSGVLTLPNAPKLNTLNLENNQISDISVISKYLKIKDLYIRHNNIVDISAIANFKFLKHFVAEDNRIADIDALVKSGISGTDASAYLVANCLDFKTSPDIDNYRILSARKINIESFDQKNCGQ